MTTPLPPVSALSWVTLVADADTPGDAVQYAGRKLGLTADQLNQLSFTTATTPGVLAGIRGYLRSTGEPEWVMVPILDRVTVEHIRDIPANGWVDTTQRQVYRQAARQLIEAGVLPADVRTILSQLYAAAVANHTAPT